MLLSIWDTMIAFNIIIASVWAALLKGMIGLGIMIPLVQRYFTMYGEDIRKVRTIVKVILWSASVCFVIVVYVHMNCIKGLCICIWNRDTPGYNIKNVHLSTAIGRSSYPST